MTQNPLPFKPSFLAGVLAVEGELKTGYIGRGNGMTVTSKTTVLVSALYSGSLVVLYAETSDGQLTRIAVPGPEFLHLTEFLSTAGISQEVSEEELIESV